MAKELSPESKLYIKEEIENAKKEIKEEIEKVKSKSTKIFTTIVVVVGFLTGMGVYGLVQTYVKDVLKGTTFKTMESEAEGLVGKINSYEVQVKKTCDFIADRKKDVNDIVSKLKLFDQKASLNGYAWIGDVKLVWGTTSGATFKFPFIPKPITFSNKFPKECFAVFTDLDGIITNKTPTDFTFFPLFPSNLSKSSVKQLNYLAIGR